MTTSLSPELLVLSIIDASDGHLRGKTLLQKRAFFLSEHLESPVGFDAHFYGPYSSMVNSTLGRLKSLGLIREQSEGFGRSDEVGFEWRRYEFALTDDGRQVLAFHERQSPGTLDQVRCYLKKMQIAGDNGDYVNLSIAAKTFFILKREQRPMEEKDIQSIAKRLGWNIQPEQIEKAGKFLERLGVVAA